MQSILRQRLLKDVTSFRFGESREDSGKSWLHKNDHLYAGRTYLTRSPGKTKCFAKFIQRAMPMPRSTVITWTGFMLISNIVRQRAAFGGPTKVHWPARSGTLAGMVEKGGKNWVKSRSSPSCSLETRRFCNIAP